MATHRDAVRVMPAEPSPERALILASQVHALMLADRYEESAVRCAEAIAIAQAAGAHGGGRSCPQHPSVQSCAAWSGTTRRSHSSSSLSRSPRRWADPRLTQREEKVLALVAAGHTNAQIARTLFISDKTASVHVSRILTKLGVATRGQAAALAHRRGLVKQQPVS